MICSTCLPCSNRWKRSFPMVVAPGRCAANAEDFFEYNDQVNFNAVLTLLMHAGETVAKLSDDLLQNSPDVPWDKVRGLRHHIAHDYRVGYRNYLQYHHP